MHKVVEEDLFKHAVMGKAVFVTTNQVIKPDGRLVMGAGAARQAAIRWPELPKMAAPYKGQCSFVMFDAKRGIWVGIFPVKEHFRDKAKLDLIKKSGEQLAKLADRYPFTEFHCNYPGVGKGGLSWREVDGILDSIQFPANVTFHTMRD